MKTTLAITAFPFSTVLLFLASSSAVADVRLAQVDDRVRGEKDGNQFTEWRQHERVAAYLDSVIGPSSACMPWPFPMQAGMAGASQDHPWHHAVRFAHSDVAGFHFCWADSTVPAGRSLTRKHRFSFPHVDASAAKIATHNQNDTRSSVTLAAQTAVPASQQRLFHSGQEGYPRYRIPTLVVTNTGNLLAICEGRKAGGGLTGNVDLVCKRSRDNGRTWSKLQRIGDFGDDTFGNQSAVVDRHTGVIWVACTCSPGEHLEATITRGETDRSTRVFVFFSDDDGETWSKPRDITSAVKRPAWTWYGCGPGVGIQLRDGRLLFAAYHCEGKQGETVRSHAIFSDDHGKTWQLGGNAGGGNGEPQMLQRRDGSIYLSARTSGGPHQRSVADSTDGGKTWSPKRFDKSLYDPFCQASLLKLPPTDGQPRWLYCHPTGPGRRNLTVRMSIDEGRTWNAGTLRLRAGDSQYSSMARLRNGQVGVLYDCWQDNNYQLYFTTFAPTQLQPQ